MCGKKEILRAETPIFLDPLHLSQGSHPAASSLCHISQMRYDLIKAYAAASGLTDPMLYIIPKEI